MIIITSTSSTHSLTTIAKNLGKPLSSFALVPSADPFPLTSNVMIMNREGELELHGVHDTPTHTPWSPRGDLSIGIGTSYRTIRGFHEREPPPEPWDIIMQPSVTDSAPQSAVRADSRDRRGAPEGRAASPPTFGRGDEDGFPALVPTNSMKAPANLAATRPGRDRNYSPAALRNLSFEHTTVAKRISMSYPKESQQRVNGGGKGKGAVAKVVRRSASPWTHGSAEAMQHCVEGDISMTIRRRVIHGYGLINVRYCLLFQVYDTNMP